MERKRQLFSKFLTGLLSMLAAGCTIDHSIIKTEPESITVCFRCPDYITRSSVDEECVIYDLNLMVFHDGVLEYKEWINVPKGEELVSMDLHLIKGRDYVFYVLANYGTELEIISLEALEDVKLELESPYLSGTGCLMSAMTDINTLSDSSPEIELCRMMAKISISIDRSALSEDVVMNVQKVCIGNCPKFISAIGRNKMENRFDRFDEGFCLSGEHCQELNRTGQGGRSGEVSLFMLENMQGDFPYEIEEDEEKVLDEEDVLSDVSSYIEIEMEYRSSRHFSTDRNLIYRFYLGEGLDDLNVERNCHYHITVTPEDGGLSGNGWRVDKTGIGTYVNQIILSETDFILRYKGQENLLEAEILPAEASNHTVIWKSSDDSIATVDADGNVTAIHEGSCSIRCTAADGSGATSECTAHVRFDPPFFIMYPGSYISGHVGDSIHIWCEFFPPNARFDPGYEELDFDKSRGIYDYTIDENGHGVTLSLKKPGTGIVYMSAGEPVKESGMTIVEVLP